jgi:hypothetical protein
MTTATMTTAMMTTTTTRRVLFVSYVFLANGVGYE